MQIEKNRVGNYEIRDDWNVMTLSFPTIEALENHIKLMLIAVQKYKENTLE